jgi:hypothetical protein
MMRRVGLILALVCLGLVSVAAQEAESISVTIPSSFVDFSHAGQACANSYCDYQLSRTEASSPAIIHFSLSNSVKQLYSVQSAKLKLTVDKIVGSYVFSLLFFR